MKTVEVITAKPSAGYSYDFLRICKGCGRKIENGERCVRYKRRGGANFHCLECGRRYYPILFDSERHT